MTKEEILRGIEKVQFHIDDMGDDEYAHLAEYELRKGFIQFVAERDDELGELARLVLTTENLDFQRSFA